MSLKKYNNLFTSEGCSTKEPKDTHILALFGLSENIMDESKKESEKSNRGPTKGEPDYIKNISP